MVNNEEEKLKNRLQVLWLRPENSLLSYFMSKALESVEFNSPSVDISCGDGLTMFLMLGGVLEPDFDRFQSTKVNEFNHSSVVDIYDSYEKDYSAKIIKKPVTTIDYGTDWKQSLLDRASNLMLYNNLLLHDNNVTPLPLPSDHFKTVFSNAIYWVKDVESIITDVHRLVHPEGIVIFYVMTPYQYETLDKLETCFNREAINILDRKRREVTSSLLPYDRWNKIMNKCGFDIEEVKSIYPHKIIMDIWNIGLRPIAHLLVRMSNAVSNEERSEIKKEWVEIFVELFKPLISIKETYTLEKAPYLMYKLRKK